MSEVAKYTDNNISKMVLANKKDLDEKRKIAMDDKAMDLLKKMLKIDPVQRISCKEALEHVRIIF